MREPRQTTQRDLDALERHAGYQGRRCRTPAVVIPTHQATSGSPARARRRRSTSAPRRSSNASAVSLPGVSLGTIYRTLDILRGIGLVQASLMPAAAATYEAALEKHHHLLCTECDDDHERERRPTSPRSHVRSPRSMASAKSTASWRHGRCARCAGSLRGSAAARRRSERPSRTARGRSRGRSAILRNA